MKSMISILSIIILFSSCEKEVAKPNYLPGKWQLDQTELYVNDSLNGSSVYSEATTIYQFDNCDPSEKNTCTLTITEDGETATHSYTYDQETGKLVLNETTEYRVIVNTDQLTLSQNYGENTSIWTFSKET